MTGFVNYVFCFFFFCFFSFFLTKFMMNFIMCSSVATSKMLEGFICQGICLLDQTLILYGVLCVQKILKDFKWLNFANVAARLFLKPLKRFSETFHTCM